MTPPVKMPKKADAPGTAAAQPMPEALLHRMREMLGAEYEEFAKSLSEKGWQALRFNRLKPRFRHVSVESIKETVIPGEERKVPWEADAWYYGGDCIPGKLFYHDIGLYYIQEPSAMMPAVILDAKPGERVLDLCAAPGGKTSQIAAAMKGEGLLVSNEPYPERAVVLSQNAERLGIGNILVTNELPDALVPRFPEFFDRILVDAPCSGEGMMRRHPEVADEWSPETVQMCAERQAGILDCAADMLKPGGIMVYSTCTFSPEENEGSIAAFLHAHPAFALVKIDMEGTAPGRRAWGDEAVPLEHTARIWPHRTAGEGHFIALLRKAGEAETDHAADGRSSGEAERRRGEAGSVRTAAKRKGRRDMPDKTMYAALADAWNDTFDTDRMPLPQRERLVCFGEKICLLPEGIEDIAGLKVKRCGLELADVKKGRVLFSHALAMTLAPEDVKQFHEMTPEEALDWFNGATLPCSARKGHILMTVSGFPAGFGTFDGRMIKNHYPRGLRKAYSR